ncbi:hypothetical protein Patl1_09132 [Pistacia atlantica]|uniref:Uncharacterized protein n=1 Tax=Pistacia atlantica TaxID=434234 RepID=A0ACC1ALK4_9ROSI|nr:hypothetical protein Patl1_09132 [Pistacia atlantica]
MENHYETPSNGEVTDPSLQIINNFQVDDLTPEFLTVNHIPLGPDTVLEVNGGRSSIYSDGVSSLLRRDRVDKKSEEATFVSTDRESKSNVKRWSMNCEPEITAGTGFLKGKHVTGPESPLPTIEVYVTGCYSGTPIILTKTLQLSFRKKHNRKGMLDAIPEYETTESEKNLSAGLDLQVADFGNYKSENDEDYSNMYWRRTEYIDGEDGELSWFNAGVRVGVGIGLGIFLGLGIGVGLLVRTYRSYHWELQKAAFVIPFI